MERLFGAAPGDIEAVVDALRALYNDKLPCLGACRIVQDADRLDAYYARLDVIADLLRSVLLETPPNVTQGQPLAAIGEFLKAGKLANRARKLGLDIDKVYPLVAHSPILGTGVYRLRGGFMTTPVASRIKRASAHVLTEVAVCVITANNGAASMPTRRA